MCTTESTFAWLGAIVVNIAFISFIVWGANAIWWVGFSISIVYTGILFGLARFIDKKSGWDETNESRSLDDEDDGLVMHESAVDYASQDAAARQMPILANLLYGLFALALGVTGYFLPINIFYCAEDRPGPHRLPGHWETNITALPEEVQDWASSTKSRDSYASFIYIPGPKVTLFQGSSDNRGGAIGLWAAPASIYPFHSAEPINFPDIKNPTQFTSVGTNKACFVAYKKLAPPPKPNPRPVPKPVSMENFIACCDGKALWTASSNTTHRSPNDFFVANGTATLWYKDDPPYSGKQIDTGTLIYSLDTKTMEETLHSIYHAPHGYTQPVGDYNEAGNDCWASQNKIARQRAFLALFVSASPVAVVSVLLWIRRQASSMAVTAYIGLSAMATFLFILIGGEDHIDTFLRWWFSVTGALWMIIMTDLSFSTRRVAKGPFIWGVNFGALIFFIGMISLTGVIETMITKEIFDRKQAWRWLVFNVFAVAPIGIIGLASDQVFLLVLCAIGWLMDSVRIASLLAGDNPESGPPVYFLVLATAGLLIAGVGWLLSKFQTRVHTVLVGYFEELSLSRSVFPVSEHVALRTEEPMLESI